jgi:hypothetical protein
MKTLIIHPEDSTTVFLKDIYKDLHNKTVVTKNKTRKEIINLIDNHDRVFMMGHGSPGGLFKTRAFPNHGRMHLIDEHVVPHLKDKENFYIWCNADKFVKKHNLKGFFSGMFISEVGEAIYCGVARSDEQYGLKICDLVKESNYGFSRILANKLHLPLDKMYKEVMREYWMIAKTNKVADYNQGRLYKRG